MAKDNFDLFSLNIDEDGSAVASNDVVDGVISNHLQKLLQQKALSRTLMLNAIKAQADSIEENKFGYKVFFDWRGRAYTHAVGISYQGKDSGKACIQAATPKALGVRGLYWLGVHVATCHGDEGKASFDRRARWSAEKYTDGSFARWVAQAFNGSGFDHYEFDEPLQAITAMVDYIAAMKSGNPENYESAIFCSFDATCSGLQIMSVLVRDAHTAEQVNVKPRCDGKRADVYLSGGAALMEVVKEIGAKSDRKLFDEKYQVSSENTAKVSEMKRKVASLVKTLDKIKKNGGVAGDTAFDETVSAVVVAENALKDIQSGGLNGSNDLWAHYWLENGVTRNTVKRPIMVFGYGGKARAMAAYIKEETPGCPWAAAQWLATVLYSKVLPVLLPKAFSLMEQFQHLAKVLASHNKPVKFTTGNGLVFHQEVYEEESDEFRVTISKGAVRLAIKTELKDQISSTKQATGIAPNIVHSFDALFLQNVVLNAKKAGVDCLTLVHDCFGYRAGDAEVMYQVLRDTWVETFSGDVIGDLWRKIAIEAEASIAGGDASYADHVNLIKKDKAKEAYAKKNEKEFVPSEMRSLLLLPPVPCVGSLDISLAADSEFIFS